MSFDPAQYCARVMDAVRAGVIRPSGNPSNRQRTRKGDWNDLGATHARDAVAAIATAAGTLLGAPGGADRSALASGAGAVGQWADHFGRCVGQFSLMADRAQQRGVVAQSLDQLDADELTAVYGYLAEQYHGIVVRLGTQPSLLKRLTVPMITVDVVDRLLATPEFVALGRAEIQHAITHFTQDPAAHLQGMCIAIARMHADVRYRNIDPSVLKHVASKWPSDPERALDAMVAMRDALRARPEFGDLSDTTVWFAATNYPKRSEAFLRSVLETIEALHTDKAFASVPKWMLEHVAVRHSKAPQATLARMVSLRETLLLEGYNDLGATALHAAVAHRSRNPYPYLEAVRTRLTQLRDSKYAAIFPESELSRVAAMYNDPETFLTEVCAAAETLAKQMIGTSFVQRARFCAYFPERTRALVAGEPVQPIDIRRALDRRDRTSPDLTAGSGSAQR